MSKTFSVMTYNVHSCIGIDGQLSPLRIAEVIDQCNPDIVALQELDAGLDRTERIDQAHLIAKTLEMSFHFHSSIQVEEGGYGNAILSRSPIHIVKAGAVPADVVHPLYERRGAVWGEVEIIGRKIQVIATHFGLNRRERTLQAKAIVGPEWLGHPDCSSPALLCGDFNALPRSLPYRLITHHLRDVQKSAHGKRAKGTFPVQFPFMRIDHLFATPDLKVKSITIPRTAATKVASDHLPLLVTLELL